MTAYYAHTSNETHNAGREFAKTLPEQAVVCLYGDLGAGKTTFIKGMATAFDIPTETVSSPTYQYLNIYHGTKTVFHFDLYRLRGYESFLELGFEEFLEQKAIICIEWTERIEEIIPQKAIRVRMSHETAGGRTIEIS